MRTITLFLALSLCVAPAFAQAAVRLHLPHKRHPTHGSQPVNGPAAPTSDVPDAIWTSTSTHR